MLINVKERETETVPIPHEPGQSMTFQRLAWAEIPVQRLNDDGASLGLLFERAITSWTYPEAATSETVRRLDDVTAQWALKTINEFNHRVPDRKLPSSPSIGS